MEFVSLKDMKKFTLISTLILISFNSFAQWSEAPSDEILIRGGWLFDGVTNSRRENNGILIQEGKIIEVDTKLKNKLHPSLITIELTDGETILPGMIDLLSLIHI